MLCTFIHLKSYNKRDRVYIFDIEFISFQICKINYALTISLNLRIPTEHN